MARSQLMTDVMTGVSVFDVARSIDFGTADWPAAASAIEGVAAIVAVVRARALPTAKWTVAVACWVFALYQLRYAAMHLLPSTWFWAKGYSVYTRFPHYVFFIAHVLGCCGALFRAPFLLLRTDPFAPRGPARIERHFAALLLLGASWPFYFVIAIRLPERGGMDAASAVILVLGALMWIAGGGALVALRRGDKVAAQRWLHLAFWLLFGAPLWRLVGYAVLREMLTLNMSPRALSFFTSARWDHGYQQVWLLTAALALSGFLVVQRRLAKDS